MPSFDVSSKVDWQELDNAVNHATKELITRFDFKGVKTEITIDQKAKTVTLWCQEEAKLESLNDVFQNKIIKRGLSILSFDYGKVEPAFGGSARQVIQVQAGISKEKGKEVIASIKDGKFKAQAQIQDEQVRVTAKSRDELQTVIGYLREQQEKIKLPMQFGNFRD